MTTVGQSASRNYSRLAPWVGCALAIAALAYVLHGTHPARALRDVSNVDWSWVLVGIAFELVSYYMQGARWKMLLMPFGHVRVTRTVRAVYAGLFANLFPLRPGELLRSYLISKGEGIGFGKAIGSVGVERLVDLVEATLALGVVSLFVELPPKFKSAADDLGIVALVLVALALAGILYFEYRLGDTAENGGNGGKPPGKFMAALVGLHAMGTSPSFYPAVLTSALMPFFQVLALWAMMRSYHLDLPFLDAVVVLLVINLGVSLPNAPANVGSYQFFCVLGLRVFQEQFQLDNTQVAGFSVFAFVMLTVPCLIVGLIATLQSGISIFRLREEIRQLPVEGRSR